MLKVEEVEHYKMKMILYVCSSNVGEFSFGQGC